jgi:hypothetical protein
MRHMKILWMTFVLSLMLTIGHLHAATSTTAITLNNSTWTDLGAGPILLSFNGSAVFAVSDTAPTLTGGIGFPIPPSAAVTVNTASHVWGLATNSYGQTKALVAPIVAP